MSRPAYGRVTIADVAAAAGVSRATAARAVSGSTLVTGPTRERVAQVAEQLGYTANPLARALAKGGGFRVVFGVVGDDQAVLADAYVGRAVAGAARVAQEAGVGVSLAWVERSRPAVAIGAIAADASVCGLVLLNTTAAALDALPRGLRPRTASVGVPGPDVPAYDVDNGAVTAALTGHLLASGRRRTVRIDGPAWMPCSQRPHDAYEKRMRDAGLPARSVAGGSSAADGVAAAQTILARWPDTDAILASCDATALGVISSPRSRGIDVPGDVAVTGFDDIPIGPLGVPALTTATHPVEAIAAAATRGVLSGRAPGGVTQTFPSQPVLRQSA